MSGFSFKDPDSHGAICQMRDELKEKDKEIARLRATQPRILTPPFKVEQLPVGKTVILKTDILFPMLGVFEKVDPAWFVFLRSDEVKRWIPLSSVTEIICLPDDFLDGRRDA